MEPVTLPLVPRVVAQGDHEATLIIENCAPGYGVTLGNSLQRVLLSSLPGAAIVAVKIDQADHEFSTIPYVLEDVITIILNLKKIRLKVMGQELFRGRLSTKGGKGEKVITAGDLEFPSEVTVINPKAPIATLTSAKALFSMEVVAAGGFGYATAQANKEAQSLEAGMMAMDSIFSPVLKVNYRVENMRVGERTDFNRLTFTLKTDGSITPAAAFASAANILVAQFARLAETEKREAGAKSRAKAGAGTDKKAKRAKVDKTSQPVDEDVRAIPLGDLKLSARIGHILAEQGIKSVGALVDTGEDKLAVIPGIGDKAVKEIRRKLGRLGLILK